MIKTVIIPKNNKLQVSIPDSYIGKEIEVLLYSKDELEQKKPENIKSISDLWGSISDETANYLHKELEESRKGWENRLDKQF